MEGRSNPALLTALKLVIGFAQPADNCPVRPYLPAAYSSVRDSAIGLKPFAVARCFVAEPFQRAALFKVEPVMVWYKGRNVWIFIIFLHCRLSPLYSNSPDCPKAVSARRQQSPPAPPALSGALCQSGYSCFVC